MEYPKNYPELIKRFGDQQSCLDYLAFVRWPNGFVCAKCNDTNFWRSKRLYWICTGCEFQTSVLAGTIFQDTKLPINLWFQLIWWFMGQRSGASALSLQDNFGIGSYRTAWKILKKLRSTMAIVGREKLSGRVEVDEGFLGGTNNKEIVMIAAEVRGSATGRIRLLHIQKRTSENIHKFIGDFIEPGSTIISDKYSGYVKIVEKGYLLEAQKKPYSWEEASRDDDRLQPQVRRAISILKRWYYGTYHGRINKNNLQTYLDEFVFRFNRRKSGSRGLLFHRAIQAAIKSDPFLS